MTHASKSTYNVNSNGTVLKNIFYGDQSDGVMEFMEDGEQKKVISSG